MKVQVTNKTRYLGMFICIRGKETNVFLVEMQIITWRNDIMGQCPNGVIVFLKTEIVALLNICL